MLENYYFEIYIAHLKVGTQKISNLKMAEAIAMYEALKTFSKNNTIIDLVDQQTGEIFASNNPEFY